MIARITANIAEQSVGATWLDTIARQRTVSGNTASRHANQKRLRHLARSEHQRLGHLCGDIDWQVTGTECDNVKVKELMKALKRHDPNAEIVVDIHSDNLRGKYGAAQVGITGVGHGYGGTRFAVYLRNAYIVNKKKKPVTCPQ